MLLSLFSALNFKKTISLIFKFRMIDRNRNYSQNLNINLDVLKLHYVIIISEIDLSLLQLYSQTLRISFRNIYIYVLFKFEICGVIQKVVIIVFSLIALNILIKTITLMSFKIIIFMFLDAIVVIIIIIIIAMYRS